MTKRVLKISDKLVKVNESATVYFYDNGYMVEIGGQDINENWASVKLMCKTLDEVSVLLKEIDELPREN